MSKQKAHLKTEYKVQHTEIQSPQAKKKTKINLSKEDGQCKHSNIQHFIKQSKQLHHR